jgi:hypothetical protein
MGSEVKEVIQESTQELAKETAQAVEDIQEIEVQEQPQKSVAKRKASAHDVVVEWVEASRELAQNKHNEYMGAQAKLDETIENFIEHENKIVNTTVSDSLELLEKLGVDSLADEKGAVKEIQKDNKEQLITIKKPSKGSFKGFFVGLLGATATVGGALFYGSKITNLPFNVATLMQKSNLDTIATKYAELINVKGAIAGYALVGVSALVVGFILCKIVKAIQKSKNNRYAEKIENDTKEFVAMLDTKITKTDSLDEHIKHIKLVMQKYDIILQEQNAKIRRMLFIEQPEEGVNSLQRASKLEVEKSVLILDELLKLMNTPVNEDIDIKDESKDRLNSANSVINEVIKKLYV